MNCTLRALALATVATASLSLTSVVSATASSAPTEDDTIVTTSAHSSGRTDEAFFGRLTWTDPTSGLNLDRGAPPPADAVFSGSHFTLPTRPAAPVINCGIKVGHPHESGRNPGNINVTATDSCNAVTASLTIYLTLYKYVCTPFCHDVEYGKTGSAKTVGKTSATTSSAAACSPGEYFGSAYDFEVAPAGYTPPTGTSSGAGATIAITC